MSSLSNKSRSFWAYYPSVFKSTENGGKTWSIAKPEKTRTGSQSTDSEGHPRNPKTGNREGGGPFQTATERWEFPTITHDWRAPDAPQFRTVAALGTPITNTLLPADRPKSAEELKKTKSLSSLDPYGATAIAQVAPTNPNSNAAITIGELVKDGIPKLPGIHTWKERLHNLRQIGDEYLNIEFGWKPLLSDIKSHASSVRDSGLILKQYQKDSGANVRREFEFPTEVNESSRVVGSARPSCVPGGGDALPGYYTIGSLGKLVQSKRISTRRWFSGCFTYHTPSADDFAGGLMRNADAADKVFGIQPTPEVLWELTPWSWGIDWFSNAGDVIHNFTQLSSQGLVMRYGYVMEESITEITNTIEPVNGSIGITGLSRVPDSRYICVVKSRQAANPFGFGIGWEDLSPTQIAITAALGITRLRL